MRDDFKKQIYKKPTSADKSKLIAVRMPKELVDALEALSEKSDKSVSRIVIEAVRFVLEVPEKE